MKIILISQRFLGYSKNGISRDAEAIANALNGKYGFELRRINSTSTSKFAKSRLILRTLVSGNPKRYKSDSLISVIPQLENQLPERKGSALVRIHDLFPITNPEWFRRSSVISFKKTLKKAVKDDHTFICNSKYTQNSMLKIFPNAKTILLYCSSITNESNVCGQCQYCKLNLIPSQKYIIAVSTIEPRKNYIRLINAWMEIKDLLKLDLIIVGKYGWKSHKTWRAIKNSKNSITHLQDICNAGLAKLTSSASAYVSVSLDEGFNFSALDSAMAGIPLIISDIPVHRELYGQSAYYLDPKDVNNIKKALMSGHRIKPIISEDYLEKDLTFGSDLRELAEVLIVNIGGSKE
jgi:glycosyltransferase involved in cell wall biosynthesis